MENRYWEQTEIHIGTIGTNRSKEVIFKGTALMPEVIDIVPACGCTKLKWYPKERELRVTYKSGEIPKQVKGNQEINKAIEIFHINGNRSTLRIIGVKVKS